MPRPQLIPVGVGTGPTSSNPETFPQGRGLSVVILVSLHGPLAGAAEVDVAVQGRAESREKHGERLCRSRDSCCALGWRHRQTLRSGHVYPLMGPAPVSS